MLLRGVTGGMGGLRNATAGHTLAASVKQLTALFAGLADREQDLLLRRQGERERAVREGV